MAINLGLLSTHLVLQIFALLNPLASFPFLLAAYKKRLDVKGIALRAIITAFVTAIVIALVGPALFGVFNITVDSFRIAGGIVLMLLGLEMIRSKDDKKVDVKGIDSFITIIATPMLTGPAVISFITIKSFEITKSALLVNIAGAFVIAAFVFILFSYMIPKINAKLINILSRIMGLFLSAVAIEMIAKGISVLLLAR